MSKYIANIKVQILKYKKVACFEKSSFPKSVIPAKAGIHKPLNYNNTEPDQSMRPEISLHQQDAPGKPGG
jgi:hypothetical protein